MFEEQLTIAFNAFAQVAVVLVILIAIISVLIGIFCPFFWFAFLSGAQGNDLMFNAVHSGIVILFCLLYSATYWIQLRNEQVTTKNTTLPSQETR